MTTAPKKCPICGKPRQAEHAPFCSPRCRDRDLVKWLGDGYGLPGPPADLDGDLGADRAVDPDHGPEG